MTSRVLRSRLSRKVRRLLSRKLLVTAASAAAVCDSANCPAAESTASEHGKVNNTPLPPTIRNEIRLAGTMPRVSLLIR